LRSRHNSQLLLKPEEVKSIARAKLRAALREEFVACEDREKAENKISQAQRLRDDLRAREEQNWLNSGFTS
jgi:hypothetical protein